MKATVDCHMVCQRSAGDAGNARFHTLLTNALAGTARADDRVAALIAHPEAIDMFSPTVATRPVPAGNVSRLTRGAAKALRGDDAAIFSYIVPTGADCPLAVVVHDVAYKMYPQWFSRRDRVLLSAAVPWSLRRAAAAIAVSEHSRAALIDAYRLDPGFVHVVHNVPAPAFSPDPTAEDRVRARFGLDRYCLYVGDVHPRKNLAALADAVKRMDGGHRLQLAIVGRPGHRGKAIITASGARWLGPVEDGDLADLYRAATVTCYPSLYEGFGLPVVEAMACGSPVVASNRGAIPEVAGDAAILVEPTPDGLAEGLRAALDESVASRLRSAGPPRAATFTPTAMGNAAWSVLRAIAR